MAEQMPCPATGEGYCMNCMMFGGDTTDYKCWPVDQYVKYYVKHYGFVTGEEKMQAEIYARGPITCGLVCPNEFTYGYKGGVIEYYGNETDVDHDVEVVGWGEDKGVPYWKVRNSWGTYWGEDGFFRVLRGKNMLRIEEQCAWATLDLGEEKEMRTHKVTGSMFGVTKPDNDAWRFLPADPKDPLINQPPETKKHIEHHEQHLLDREARYRQKHPTKDEEPETQPPTMLMESNNIVHESTFGIIPLVALILVGSGLYITWRFYAPKSYTSDYQAI